jgi:hypothetical protein
MTSDIQHKAFLKLLGFNYRIVYKKGKENFAADALSRQNHAVELQAISVSKPRWLEEIVEYYEKDPDAKKFLTELSISRENDKCYQLKDGLIRYKGKV